MRTGFLKLDSSMEELNGSGEKERSGTTAICAILTPDCIFFANLGKKSKSCISWSHLNKGLQLIFMQMQRVSPLFIFHHRIGFMLWSKTLLVLFCLKNMIFDEKEVLKKLTEKSKPWGGGERTNLFSIFWTNECYNRNQHTRKHIWWWKHKRADLLPSKII